jgi:hypothetical protein
VSKITLQGLYLTIVPFILIFDLMTGSENQIVMVMIACVVLLGVSRTRAGHNTKINAADGS